MIWIHFNHKWFQTSKYCRDGLQAAGTPRDRKEPTKATQGRSLWKISQVLTTPLMLNLMLNNVDRKKVVWKGGDDDDDDDDVDDVEFDVDVEQEEGGGKRRRGKGKA